jgi:hypothetical protein
MTFASALIEVPGRVAAVEYSGTSPAFSPDTSWGLYLGFFGVGDLIEWDWTTSSTLDFALIRTTDSTVALGGFSNYDGYLVDVPGHYGLRWINNNWFSSATVSYWVAAFTPSLSVSTPLEGAYLNSRTVSVLGTTDPYAIGVLVGPDALHLREADWSGNDWGVDGLVLNEGQNSILVRSYYWLDYYGYENITYDKTIHVVADTTPPELSITSPSNDSFMPAPVSVIWHSSDPTSSIAKQEYKFDDGIWFDATSLSPPYIVILPTTLGDGGHTIYVRATDGAGNQALRSVLYIEDSTPPELTILSPSQDSYTQSTSVEWQASDNIGLDTECQLVFDNSGMVVVEMSASSSVYQHRFDHFQDGPHTVQLWVRDFANNWVMKTVNFTVDTTDPLLQISGPVDGSTIRGNYVTVTWKYSDNIGIKDVRMTIDGVGGDIVENGQLTDLKLANGHHTIDITVTDLAGNQVTKRVAFTMDSQALSFSGPYYGIPLVAIMAAVILVALFVVLKYVRKPKIAAPPETPKEMQ